MLYQDLCANLCNFDKRTVELLLSRLVKYPPPSHLADIGIAQVQETFGRERRFRYYTVTSFRAIIEREKLQDQDVYSSIDFSNVGGFAPLSEDMFWEKEEERNAHVDGMKGRTAQNAAKKAAGKRAKKIADAGEAGGSAAVIKPKRGRKRKLEDGDGDGAITEPPAKKKKGRPPKKKAGEEGDGSVAHEGIPGATLATENATAGEQSPLPATPSLTPIPKRRGRPPKAKIVDESSASAAQDAATDATPISTSAATPKRRGRPPKRKQSDIEPASASVDPPPPKKRGRPRKSTTTAPSATPEDPEVPATANDVDHIQEEPPSSQLNDVDGGENPIVEDLPPSSQPPLEQPEEMAMAYPEESEEDHSTVPPVQKKLDQAVRDHELSTPGRATATLSVVEEAVDDPAGSLTTPGPVANSPSDGVSAASISEPLCDVEQRHTPMNVDTSAPPPAQDNSSSSLAPTLNAGAITSLPVQTTLATYDIPIDPALLPPPSTEVGVL